MLQMSAQFDSFFFVGLSPHPLLHTQLLQTRPNSLLQQQTKINRNHGSTLSRILATLDVQIKPGNAYHFTVHQLLSHAL